jgi:hypothetical protein
MATLLKHTVKPSGGDFTTLDAAIDHLAASHSNLVTADVYAEIEISGSWSSPDAAAVTISSGAITTDATRYISIYTDTANRATMPWDANKYNLTVTAGGDGVAALTISALYVRVSGLQIKIDIGAYSSNRIVDLSGTEQRLSDCLCVANNSYYGITSDATTAYIWDCVSLGAGRGINCSSGTMSIYNCVSVTPWIGIRNDIGTVTCKNCYAEGDYEAYVGTITLTTCASADTTGTAGLQNVALGTDTFVNVTGGSEDFHLAADGLSPLENTGTNTSGDPAPLNFTTDMDGVTFADDWDIGAFANVSAIVAPTVTTTAISAILGTSATSGGTVTNTGGEAVTAQGVCWSTSANPTTADSKTDDMADPSPFASSITGLTANTIYHVRAYATNSAGTGYGSDVQFETDVVPTVTTTAISLLLHTTATSGGNVTADGGSTITARGVCWNTSTLPTTANSKTTDAGTTGAFTSSVTGLTKATTYHLRAYATNAIGTSYGSEVDFTTDTLADISDAVFTVTEATTPVVTSLSDSTLYSGETITITGTNFGTAEGYVRFVWNYAAIASWSATSIVVTVPPFPVAGNLYVGLPTEVWSAGTAYTILAPAGITSGGSVSLGMSIGI